MTSHEIPTTEAHEVDYHDTDIRESDPEVIKSLETIGALAIKRQIKNLSKILPEELK